MKTLLFLALVLIVLCSAMARKCPYRCTKQTCKRTGLFNWWRRCSTKTYTCYKECPEHGGWTPFRVISQSACSVTCGVGTQRVTKTRTCTDPVPSNGGRPCSGSASVTVSQTCRASPCPVHGGWTSWKMAKGPCSVTCGMGTRAVRKTRTCTNPSPRNGGRPCSGPSSSTFSEICTAGSCPKVDGGWTQYRTVSRTNCSVTCGNGTVNVTQTRDCTNPAPQHGGADCQGQNTRQLTLPCSEDPCAVDGGWTQYRTVSRTNCSVTCGNGTVTVTQTRDCTNPAPQHGGADCQGQNTRQLSEPCALKPCPVNGGWTQYRTVSRTNCSVTCGNGTVTVTQTRDCTNPAPQHGGADCQGQNTRQIIETCSEDPCPAAPSCTEGGEIYHSAADKRYFYLCFNGTAFLQKCPEKTVWNNTARVCDHERMTTTTTTASPSSFPSFQTTTPSPSSATASAPNPPSCAEGAMTAVPGKCANFNWCVNGMLIEMSCAPGSLFDVSNGRCDIAANVKCDG